MRPPAGSPYRSAWSWRAGASVGALSAFVALALAELLALILPGQPSIVVGIANRIIDLTPAKAREFMISAVGTADKPLLVAGIVLVILAVGAGIGARFREQASASWPIYLGLGLLTGFIAGASSAALIWCLAVGVGGALGGWATLAILLRTDTVLMANADGSPVAKATPTLPRRTFLMASAIVGAVAVGGVALLSATRGRTLQAVDGARDLIKLPAPVKIAPPISSAAALNIADMPPPITPNSDFYRIDTALAPPIVNTDGWSLTIGGLVNKPLRLSYADLMAMPQVQQYVTLACVSNPVGGDLVDNALWQGVPLRALLEQAGIGDGAEQLVAESVDGFTAAFPLKLAQDGREPMVAVGMNGVALPVDHGFPARLVVPGLYGYVSATKWLTEIRLTTFAQESPFWIERGWIADGTIESASRIDVPENGASIPTGNVVIAGRAWHQRVPIGSVELSVNDGPWQEAVLAASMGIDTWRLWSWNWAATPGSRTLRVRMIDADGKPQSANPREPGPGASSGYDSITLDVT